MDWFTKRIYLDWASASPVSKEARKVFARTLAVYGNPSSPHEEGLKAREVIEDARRTIARLVAVKTENVIFTSGATEANALAILGSVRRAALTGVHVLYLPTSHASIVENVEQLQTEGVTIEPLRITEGKIDLEHLKTQIRPETVLVTMDLICGETGTRWDARDVRRVLDSVRKGILLHVDASQAAYVELLEHTRLGADLITLDAQKMGGVRGVGALIRTKHSLPLEPLYKGGGQQGGIRSGTESPALIAAFAAAFAYAQKEYHHSATHAEELRTYVLAHIPRALINVGKEHAPHILNLSFPGIDTDYAVMLLSEAGIAVSTKSACETNAEGSRVVLALTGSHERAEHTLRISWGPGTRMQDIKEFIDALAKTIRFIENGAIH